MDSPFSSELQAALEAIEAAARLSRAVLELDDKSVVQKDDLSPVTTADFAIQALLTATLHHAFPHYGFVGEEDAAALRADPALLERVWDLLQDVAAATGCKVPESRERLCDMIDWCGRGVPRAGDGASSRVWVFDPIDGTQAFVRNEMYAINVALLEGGRQVLGVVACPLLSADGAAYPVADDSTDPHGRGSVLFAVRGHGTFVRPLLGELLGGGGGTLEARRVVPAAAPATSASQLRSVSCYRKLDSGVDDAHRAATERLGVEFPGCDLVSWVARWAVLALGIASVSVWVYKKRTRRAKIWDHAGAVLLFEEAGGRVTDVDGRDLDFAAGRTLAANYGFVAAPRHLHGAVLSAVHETLREQEKWEQLGSN